MGSFMKRDAQRKVEPLAIVKPELRSLRLADVEEHLAQLRKSELEKTPSVSQWADARNQMFHVYDDLAKNVCKVDSNRLTDADRKLLAQVVYEEIPEAVEQAVEDGIDHWWSNKSASYTPYGKDALKASCAKVREILKKQRDPEYQLSELIEEEQQAQLSALKFPRRAFANEELAAALTLLEKSWKAACQRSLNAEESYTVQAIAASYLPDTWQAIKGFETFPTESRQKVEAHVLEQLELLHEQVEVLLSANVEASLAAVETQTQFLRAKREHTRPSRLKLWWR